MRYLIALSIAGTLSLSASQALADQNKEAQTHFANGLRLYADKDYEGSAKELQASYDLKNDQTTLFALAQAHRLNGSCERSKELLSSYIANGANAKQSKAAFDLMDKCTPKNVTGPVADDPVVKGPVDDTAITNTTSEGGGTGADMSGGTLELESSEPSKHWYRDWKGVTLLASGGVGLAVSALSFSSATTKESDARKEGVTYDEFLSLRSDAEDGRTAAVIFGVAGGALLSAGAVYILMDKFGGGSAEENQAGGMAFQVAGGGGSFSYTGSF